MKGDKGFNPQQNGYTHKCHNFRMDNVFGTKYITVKAKVLIEKKRFLKYCKTDNS